MDEGKLDLMEFIAYLRKAGHWGTVRKYFVNYARLLESREERQAAALALHQTILEAEGFRDD